MVMSAYFFPLVPRKSSIIRRVFSRSGCFGRHFFRNCATWQQRNVRKCYLLNQELKSHCQSDFTCIFLIFHAQNHSLKYSYLRVLSIYSEQTSSDIDHRHAFSLGEHEPRYASLKIACLWIFCRRRSRSNFCLDFGVQLCRVVAILIVYRKTFHIYRRARVFSFREWPKRVLWIPTSWETRLYNKDRSNGPPSGVCLDRRKM